LQNGFTNWDDPDLLLDNNHIRSLSLKNVAELFATSYGGFGGYTPLVFVSYAIEYHFFRLNPKAFHSTNLILHIINSLLVFWLVTIIGSNMWIGFLAAAFFGVHPLHVEAVAWIQGRKDLLFSLFYLSGLVCYGLFLKKKAKKIYYILSLLFFALSLFSKVAAVSLPLVLLLMEYHMNRKLHKRSIVRAVPFILLSLAFLALALITVGPESAVFQASKEHSSLLHNLGLFFYSFVFYVGKFLIPIRLYARYSAGIGQYAGNVLLSATVFAAACLILYTIHRRRREAVVFGTTFFFLTLMPTLPFHFVGQPYADRYMYLPLFGFLLIFAMFIDPILSEGPKESWPRTFWSAFLAILIILLGIRTWNLSKVWRDSVSLWSEVIKNDPRNATAFVNRSNAYLELDQLDKAMADFTQAEKFDPGNPNIYNNRGTVYFKRGEYDNALRDYNRAIALNPRYYNGYYNRGTLWGRLGEYEKAVKDYTIALELDSHSYNARYYRGVAFKKLNMTDAAIADFEAAYRISATEQARDQIELLNRQKNQRKR
jgi:tetratricopeptide (TPR) repeat protein